MNDSLAHTHRRAVLLFTRTPEHEADAKPLSRALAHRKQIAVYESMTRFVLRQIRRSGEKLFIASDDPQYDFGRLAGFPFESFGQQGSTFGERLLNALNRLFASGYDDVVCVGNDCLEIRATDLRRTFDLLSTSSLVLGKAEDGGVYAIGIRKDAMCALEASFVECRWESRFLFEDLRASAREAGVPTYSGQTRRDIDTVHDLIRTSGLLPNLRFLRALSLPVFHTHSPTSCPPPTPGWISRLLYQKAPPPAFA